MKRKINIDRIFSQIGEFGHQQMRYVFVLALMNLYAPQFMLQYTFVGHALDFKCFLENGTILENSCPGNSKLSCQKIEYDTSETDSIVNRLFLSL